MAWWQPERGGRAGFGFGVVASGGIILSKARLFLDLIGLPGTVDDLGAWMNFIANYWPALFMIFGSILIIDGYGLFDRLGLNLPTFGSSKRRSPIKDILPLAEKAGWVVRGDGNGEMTGFFRGLREAAASGAIKFWGRHYRRTLQDENPVLEIKPEHWEAYKFDVASLLDTESTNMGTSSYSLDQAGSWYNGAYSDLRIDMPAFRKWLRQDAKAYRGRS